MKCILTLKHWQLFLLILIPPSLNLESPWGEILGSISLLTLFAWIYAIGFYGQEIIVNRGLKTDNFIYFKFNTLLSCFYFLIAISLEQNEKIKIDMKFDLKTIVVLIIGFYCLFAAFQAILFVCRTLVTIEQNRNVILSDYFVTFVLIGNFIFGIWFVQPRINKIFKGDNLDEKEAYP